MSQEHWNFRSICAGVENLPYHKLFRIYPGDESFPKQLEKVAKYSFQMQENSAENVL